MAKGLRMSEADLAAFLARGQKASSAAIAAVRKYAGTKGPSKLEIRFDQQLAVQGMPPAIANYLFLENRNLEIDRAWPQWKVGVEIQGGAHIATKANLARDCEKMCLAIVAGWIILPLDKELVTTGRGVEILQTILGHRRAKKGPRH